MVDRLGVEPSRHLRQIYSLPRLCNGLPVRKRPDSIAAEWPRLNPTRRSGRWSDSEIVPCSPAVTSSAVMCAMPAAGLVIAATSIEGPDLIPA